MTVKYFECQVCGLTSTSESGMAAHMMHWHVTKGTVTSVKEAKEINFARD